MESDEVRYQARIAQWIEHRTANTGVAGSIPAPHIGFKALTIGETDHQIGPREVSGYPTGPIRVFSWNRGPECKSGSCMDYIRLRQRADARIEQRSKHAM